MICKNCGTNNDNNSTICSNCGMPLTNNEPINNQNNNNTNVNSNTNSNINYNANVNNNNINMPINNDVNNNEKAVNKKNNKIPFIIIGILVVLIIVVGLVSKNLLNNNDKNNNTNNSSNINDNTCNDQEIFEIEDSEDFELLEKDFDCIDENELIKRGYILNDLSEQELKDEIIPNYLSTKFADDYGYFGYDYEMGGPIGEYIENSGTIKYYDKDVLYLNNGKITYKLYGKEYAANIDERVKKVYLFYQETDGGGHNNGLYILTELGNVYIANFDVNNIYYIMHSNKKYEDFQIVNEIVNNYIKLNKKYKYEDLKIQYGGWHTNLIGITNNERYIINMKEMKMDFINYFGETYIKDDRKMYYKNEYTGYDYLLLLTDDDKIQYIVTKDMHLFDINQGKLRSNKIISKIYRPEDVSEHDYNLNTYIIFEDGTGMLITGLSDPC